MIASDTNIADAVQSLYDAIVDDVTADRDELITEIAEEFGVRSVLLSNKFAQFWGTSPQSYEAPVVDHAAIRAKALDAAIATAKRIAADYTMSFAAAKMVGKQFSYDGEEYVFAVYRAGFPTWAIRAVRVSDDVGMKFSIGCLEAIMKQIES